MIEIICEVCESVLVVDDEGVIINQSTCDFIDCPYEIDFLYDEDGDPKELNFHTDDGC